MKSSSDASCGSEDAPIAVFDFDGTLTCCDSLLPFLRLCSGRLRFWAGLMAMLPFLPALARDQAKERLLQRFLRGRKTGELEELAERFCERRLPALVNAAMLAQLALLGFLTAVLAASASVMFPDDMVFRTVGSASLLAGLFLMSAGVVLHGVETYMERRGFRTEARDVTDASPIDEMLRSDPPRSTPTPAPAPHRTS